MVRLFRPILSNIIMRLTDKFSTFIISQIEDFATTSSEKALAEDTDPIVDSDDHPNARAHVNLRERYWNRLTEKMLPHFLPNFVCSLK